MPDPGVERADRLGNIGLNRNVRIRTSNTRHCECYSTATVVPAGQTLAIVIGAGAAGPGTEITCARLSTFCPEHFLALTQRVDLPMIMHDI